MAIPIIAAAARAIVKRGIAGNILGASGGRKAGSGLRVTISGTEELTALLKAFPTKIANKAVRKGTRAGVKVIARTAKRFAPRRTGRLVRSIKVRAMKRRRGRIGAVVITGEGTFKGDTFYGGFLEFGWFAGKRKGGRKSRQSSHITLGHRKVEGVHYMERAAKAKARTAGRVASAVIKAELDIGIRNSAEVKRALRPRIRRRRT